MTVLVILHKEKNLLSILLVIDYIPGILGFYVHRICHEGNYFKILLP
jgi:hypothetical protein